MGIICFKYIPSNPSRCSESYISTSRDSVANSEHLDDRASRCPFLLFYIRPPYEPHSFSLVIPTHQRHIYLSIHTIKLYTKRNYDSSAANNLNWPPCNFCMHTPTWSWNIQLTDLSCIWPYISNSFLCPP